MLHEMARPRRRWRLALLALLGAMVLLVVTVLVVHTRPVRSYVLRYAIRAVERLGLRLDADRLDYNLATLRVAVAGIRLTAVGHDEPFFTADRVQADLAALPLGRALAFEQVTIERGVVAIVRRADGELNLPQSEGESTGEPPAIPIARLQAPALAVSYRDPGADLVLTIPGLDVDLARRGRLALTAPAEVSVAGTATRIDTFEGGVGFDGRDLQLTAFRVAAPEAQARLDGTLALMRSEPRVDLRVDLEAALERAAKWWGQTEGAPRGTLRAAGTVAGPLSAPTAELDVEAPRVEWQQLDVRGLAARTRIGAEGAAVRDVRFELAGGRLAGEGDVEWRADRARLAAQWTGLDATALTRAFAGGGLAPTGRLSGTLSGAGPLASLAPWSMRARVEVTDGGSGRDRLAVPGRADLTLADGRWTLAASHVVGDAVPVEVALGGRVDGADVAASSVDGAVRAAGTDLQAMARMLAVTGLADVNAGDLSGSVAAAVQVTGTLRRPSLGIGVESSRLTLFGQALDAVRADARLDGSLLTLDALSADQGPLAGVNDPLPAGAGVDGIPGAGRIMASGTYDLARRQHRSTVRVSAWRLLPTEDRPLAGAIALEYTGDGVGTRVTGSGRLDATALAWDGFRIGDASAGVELAGDEARVSATVPSFSTTAEATVRLDAPYRATVQARAEGLTLRNALQGVELPVSLEGVADLRVDADLPLQQWRDGRASLDLTRFDGQLETLPVRLQQPARLRYEAGFAVVDRFDVAVGNTPLSVSGDLPLENESRPVPPGAGLLATLTGDLNDVVHAAGVIASAVGQSPDRNLPTGSGPIAVLARVTGSAAAPVFAANVELGPARMDPGGDLLPIEELRMQAQLANDVIELRELVGTYGGARVQATGRAPIALLRGAEGAAGSGEAVVQATATGLTSAVLAPFVDPAMRQRIGGSIDARVDLRAPSLRPEAATGEIVLDRLALVLADVPIAQQAPTRIAVRDGVARVESWRWEGEGTSLQVAGQVDLVGRQTAVTADGRLDARMLTPFIGSVNVSTGGRVETRLAITGPLDEPTIDGDVLLADGVVRLLEPRVLAEGLDVRARLEGSRAIVESLTGTVNGGSLTGSGEFRFGAGGQSRFTSTIEDMALEFPQGLRSEIDSTLELTMAEDGGRLSGSVTIARGAYREPLALVAGVLANLQRSANTTGAERSPFLDSLALDVRVITDEDLIIQNNVARAQVGADLRVINVASAPALSGRLEIREGGQLYLGRNTYTVQSGAVDFANPTVIEPILGVQATTRVSGVEIQVEITGPPETLMTALTSPTDPELGQPDLASLLLTGRRMDELGEQQASEVGAQVLGNLAGDVLGFAGRAVGLDTLRFGSVDTSLNTRDLGDLATAADPTTRVTFGKSIGSKLDVTLSQSLLEGDAQTWIIDYLPVRRIALRLVSDDNELLSGQFRHDLAFGTGPQAVRSNQASRSVERPRVSAVRLTGTLAFPEERLRRELRLGERDRFDFIDWQDDRDRLERFYQRQGRLTARISAGREDLADGTVQLNYEIDAGPATTVVVTGADLPQQTITRIETAWSRAVFDAFLREEAERIVREELARQGIYEAGVMVGVQDAGEARTLSVVVTPGARASRIEVALEGVDEELRGQLMGAVGSRQRAEQALTDPPAFERAVTAALEARGFLEAAASVGLPVAAGDTVTIPVSLVPGPQFHVGRMSFEQEMGITEDDLRREIGLTEGDVYRVELAEQARIRLQGRYRREGYSIATLALRQNIRADEAQVDLTFVVAEGARQVIGSIAITGLRSVDEDVVVRALRLKEGEALRTSDWLEARRRLFETGLFRRVDIAIDPEGEVTGETQPVGVRVLVEEWPGLRLRYGFQVTEARPEEEVQGTRIEPGISADLTRRTLFGRAVTLGLAGQYEARQRIGRVFVNTPTMFGRPLQTSLVVERSREERAADTLVTSRTSGSLEQRLRRGNLRINYGVRFEQDRTYDTDPNPELPFDLTVHVGRLTGAASWDGRDDAADATRGTFLSSSLEHASRALQSDLLYVRSLTQAYHFRPLGRLVLASAARFGVIVPLAGQELLRQDRFFAGGARTVRGVVDDSLGGVDFLGPVGGKTLLVLNQEARFPIRGWLRGVAFVDAGNVFAEPRDTSLGDLVGSAGIGLRLATPFALFRVDYARTIVNRPAPDSGRWVFGIGQAF